MSEERPNYPSSPPPDLPPLDAFLVVRMGRSPSVLAYDNLPLALELAKEQTARDGAERIVAATIARTSAGPRPVEVTMIEGA